MCCVCVIKERSVGCVLKKEEEEIEACCECKENREASRKKLRSVCIGNQNSTHVFSAFFVEIYFFSSICILLCYQ